MQSDPAIIDICAGWPRGFDSTRALELGLPADQGLDEIIARFIADYGETS